MFIRCKRASDKPWRCKYYLCENHRDGGKVRQKVIAYLGFIPDLDLAIEREESFVSRGYGERHQHRLEKLRAVKAVVPKNDSIPAPSGALQKYLEWSDEADKVCGAPKCLWAQTKVGTTNRVTFQ